MPTHRDSHPGDDGSFRGRLARLEEHASSQDYLRGVVASIDAHLERLTAQSDDRDAKVGRLLEVVEAQAKTIDAYGRLIVEATDELRAMRVEQREDRAERREERKQVQALVDQAPSFVSTVPPGWRRIVTVFVAVVAVILQAIAAFKVDL